MSGQSATGSLEDEEEETWWGGIYDLLACFPTSASDDASKDGAHDDGAGGSRGADDDELDDDELRAELASVSSGALSVKQLRRVIAENGLPHADCLEKSELQERAIDALRRRAQSRRLESRKTNAAASKRAGGDGDAPAAEPAQLTLAGLDCLVVGSEEPEIVLLFLHGYQATAEELVPLGHALERVVSPHRAIQVLLPQAPGGCWWSIEWWSYLAQMFSSEASQAKFIRATPTGVPEARLQILELLTAVEAHAGVPRSRIVLAGFSQGAMLALDATLASDERLAAVIAVSGFLFAVEEWARRLARRHRGLRVLQIHGMADPMVPFYTAHWMRELLEKNGARVTLLPHAGGHSFGPPQMVVSCASFLSSVPLS